MTLPVPGSTDARAARDPSGFEMAFASGQRTAAGGELEILEAKLVDRRCPVVDELAGVDWSEHGEHAYHGADAGGMMNSLLSTPCFWLPYFSVDDIDTAHERLDAGGGSVMHGPVEVPGGGFIIQGRDPQGVIFALTGPRT